MKQIDDSVTDRREICAAAERQTVWFIWKTYCHITYQNVQTICGLSKMIPPVYLILRISQTLDLLLVSLRGAIVAELSDSDTGNDSSLKRLFSKLSLLQAQKHNSDAPTKMWTWQEYSVHSVKVSSFKSHSHKWWISGWKHIFCSFCQHWNQVPQDLNITLGLNGTVSDHLSPPILLQTGDTILLSVSCRPAYSWAE